MNRIELRPAHGADAAAIAEVLLASRKSFLPYAPIPHTDDDVRRWVGAELLATHSVTVATQGDEIVGVAAIAERDGVAWLSQLYLTEPYVGKGIGSRLLASAIASTSLTVRLYAFQQNQRARRFYERRGFVAIAFTDGSDNEERCPDALYELRRC